MRLIGKIALVTGGSRGIGRSIAMRFAAEGAVVAVHGRSASSNAATVNDIIGAGGQAFGVHGDLTEVVNIRTMFTELDTMLTARDLDTGLDILVNNAGIAPTAAIESCGEELFDEIFAVNARAPFFIIQEALKRMRGGGRIINVSTAGTRIALPDYAAYTASKGALNVLTVTLAQQLGARGITANAIAPGVVATDTNAAWLNADSSKAVSLQTALGRVGRTEDLPGLAAFLASSDGAWITAQIIEVSGGLKL